MVHDRKQLWKCRSGGLLADRDRCCVRAEVLVSSASCRAPPPPAPVLRKNTTRRCSGRLPGNPKLGIHCRRLLRVALLASRTQGTKRLRRALHSALHATRTAERGHLHTRLSLLSVRK